MPAPEFQPRLLPTPPRRSWQSRLLRFCLGIFCLEVGLFLLIFPWLDSWHLNYFATTPQWLEPFWDERPLRGAISGLGVLNLWVAGQQFLRSWHR
jgi:hypothetical protein